MEKQILRIERRIAQLERQASRTLTASDKSWLANKFDELESWVLGTRRKNKKSLDELGPRSLNPKNKLFNQKRN